MKHNLIDPEDPGTPWIIEIDEDGRVISLKERIQAEANSER